MKVQRSKTSQGVARRPESSLKVKTIDRATSLPASEAAALEKRANAAAAAEAADGAGLHAGPGSPIHFDVDARVRWLKPPAYAKGKIFGTVKFYGNVEFAAGIWVGVALDELLGKNDGVVKEKRYFQCQHGYGIFVRPETLEAATPGEETAAVTADGSPGGQQPAGPPTWPPTRRPLGPARTRFASSSSEPPSEGKRGRRPSSTPSFGAPEALPHQHLLRDQLKMALEQELREELQTTKESLAAEFRCQLNAVKTELRGELQTVSERLSHELKQHLLSANEDMAESLRSQLQLSVAASEVSGGSANTVGGSGRRASASAGRRRESQMEKLMCIHEWVSERHPEGDHGDDASQKASPSQKLSDSQWRARVPVPSKYLARGCEVAETHHRSIALQDLNDFGDFANQVLTTCEILLARENAGSGRSDQRITWDNVNLYHINDLLVMPLTRPFNCAFAEVVGHGPQDPLWFVSHWWGTAFKDTLRMLNFHQAQHALQARTPYWLCTFANNQHDLGELEQPDLLQTPFAIAITSGSCLGTLMLMDEHATPFTRAWCVLENFVTTTVCKNLSKQQRLEIAAVIREGSQFYGNEESGLKAIPDCAALLMDSGAGHKDERVEIQGAWFPCLVAQRAVKADIEQASVSNESDKHNILRLIAGIKDPQAEVPAADARYREVNRSIHAVFAARVLISAAMDGQVDIVRDTLASGLCGPDVWDMDGNTPAYLAASHGQVPALEALVAAKANLDIADVDGVTPVSVAVQQEETKALKVLLDAGADANKTDLQGTGPLIWAVAENDIEAMRLLLEAKADVNLAAHDGSTPLHVASEGDQPVSLRMLLEAKADTQRQTKEGQTALQVARMAQSEQAVKVLLKAGARSQKQDSDSDGDEGLDDEVKELASARERKKPNLASALRRVSARISLMTPRSGAAKSRRKNSCENKSELRLELKPGEAPPEAYAALLHPNNCCTGTAAVPPPGAGPEEPPWSGL
eukprot:TRINITY_DN69114_c0_g1_i1.p1 TRINITY_DN69114_c0_g1~~TRINITY_DN69114_c0_g1_i1.p1  ORF type:complete len:983 (-),score=270.31 TRINITY_DN69114_c0_g1_i1:294-3242(-)